jgi:hypothetical protein
VSYPSCVSPFTHTVLPYPPVSSIHALHHRETLFSADRFPPSPPLKAISLHPLKVIPHRSVSSYTHPLSPRQRVSHAVIPSRSAYNSLVSTTERSHFFTEPFFFCKYVAIKLIAILLTPQNYAQKHTISSHSLSISLQKPSKTSQKGHHLIIQAPKKKPHFPLFFFVSFSIPAKTCAKESFLLCPSSKKSFRAFLFF